MYMICSNFSYWNPLSWLQLWNENAIEDCEQKIFKNIKTPLKRFYVNDRSHSSKIWTITTNTQSQNLPIVLVHGFCGGSALWLNNIEELSAKRPLIAFDLLGFGRSSRPLFSKDPQVAETQFVESIEDWRKHMGLREFILLGHSFGGYIACAYTLKHPECVKALILADPWGFTEKTDEPRPDTPIPTWIRALTKVSQVFSPLFLYRILGFPSFSLLKWMRPDIVKRYQSKIGDSNLMLRYIFHANNLKPTGEEGFKSMSKYHGNARMPMIKRIDKIKIHIPIWFIYGTRTWIDYTAAYFAVWLRQCVYQKAQISVELISGAGHYVYADRPKEFNDYIRYLLEEIGIKDNGQNPKPDIKNKFWFCSDNADVNEYLFCKFHEHYQ